MSGTYGKLIKDATKPKPGAPKPKYIDPILASTFSQDGSLADVCRALALRLRESNSTVVFKTLIIIHTMIRNGAVDNVLSHLAADIAGLKLKNVSQGGNWQGEKWLEVQFKDGDASQAWKDKYGSRKGASASAAAIRYDAPRSLPPYAAYLDDRIKAFRELKHDVIRSSDGAKSKANGGDGVNRLRRLKVEKGLLREVSMSQRVLSRLLDCAFFHDDLGDDLNLSAFRMVLKDILASYTAINEGVINILEHYFEMSHPDATKALDIYKRFCRHTEKVVAYLSAAKKASYALNVTIPQLKHAPVSLAGALEEYLNDKDFEKNRMEYKENKRIADGLPPSTSTPAATKTEEKKKITIQEPSAEDKVRPPKPPTNSQAVQDFFSSLESEMGGGANAGAPNGGGAFGGGGASQFSMAPQATGMAWFGSPDPSMGGMQPQMGLQQQMTGYNPFMGGGGGMFPQQTAMGFAQQPPPQQQSQMFLEPQQTAMPGGGLAPQATGFNPFRQSMMMSQPTGAFGGGMQPQVTGMGPMGAFDATPYTQQVRQQMEMQRLQKEKQQQQQQQDEKKDGNQEQAQQTNGINSTLSPPSVTFSPPPSTSSPAPTKPLFAQKTGSRNPFAPPPGERPPTPPPAVPKGPSLAELAMGGAGLNGPTQGGGGNYGLGAGAWDGQGQSKDSGAGGSGSGGGLLPQKTGVLGSVASEFTSAGRNAQGGGGGASGSGPGTPLQQGSQLDALSTGFSSSLSFGSGPGVGVNSQSTGLTSPSLMQSQPTGFGGSNVKPFKPESSFGAALASQHPGLSAQPTGNPFAAGYSGGVGGGGGGGGGANNSAGSNGGLNPQPTSFASSLFGGQSNGNVINGQQQQQQQQSAGGPSFGSSLFGGGSNTATPTSPALQPQATGFPGSTVKPFQPSSSFGQAAFGGGGGGQQQPQQQQQAATGDLFHF